MVDICKSIYKYIYIIYIYICIELLWSFVGSEMDGGIWRSVYLC